MAKEASDNGQVIVDEDLTDAAVYERLTNDVKFRFNSDAAFAEVWLFAAELKS